MASRNARIVAGVSFLGLFLLAGVPALRMANFALTALQPGNHTPVTIEVRKGQSPAEITHLLNAQHIITDGKQFQWLGKISRYWKHVKAGEYAVNPGMTPLEIFSVITSGISVAHPITVREGENMYEIAEDIESKHLAEKDRIVELCKDAEFIASLGLGQPAPPTLEGYLFPDTYYFNRALTPEEMLKQMVRRFLAIWTADIQTRTQALGMNRHQLLTLASIVEKETGAPEERALISSVYHNRLKKKMRLQSDPTTIYGKWENFDGNIHKRDLLEKNDYNTYVIYGLPAGPIGNPGKEALHAALYPADSQFLYFVSHNDGTSEFSRTLSEHNEAVRKFQLDPKAREGKSWRDLSKRKLSNTPGNTVRQ